MRARTFVVALALCASIASVAHAQSKMTKAPELVEFVEAEYPPAELAQGKAATVVLQIAISAAGIVDDAVVLQSAGASFDAAAIAAVKRFVFRPAEIDQKPAPIR